MSKKFLVGVDIGTTGSKAMIFDGDGAVIGSAYREYTCEYPRAGWVEQDVAELLDASMEVTRLAVQQSGMDPKDVCGVSFSSQRCCTIFLDEAGELVRPMISWQDNRTAKQLGDIEKKISAQDFYEIVRMPLNTTWMISKIMWLQQEEPENWKRCSRVVQLHDYILKGWGAEEYLCDLSDTGFFGLWDTVKQEWNQQLLDVANVGEAMLPTVKSSGTAAGTVSTAVAGRTGLAEGTPLFVGAGDQNAAAFGAGVVKKGMVSVSLGTGGVLAGYLDEPMLDPTAKNMVTSHVMDNAWLFEGYQAGAASTYRWFRDEIAALESAFAREMNKDVYCILDERIAKVPPGANGLVMLPFFASATTPRWNPNARGVICGLTFNHNRDCLARAFMEGITLGVQDMFVAMRQTGIQIDEVRILGGPTKSRLWNQIQADIYNCPVVTLENSDAAIVGAAMIAGVGANVFKDFAEAAERMVRRNETYNPSPEAAAVYEKLFKVYDKAYEALDSGGVFDEIVALQE